MPKAKDTTPTDETEGRVINAGSLASMDDLDDEDEGEGVAPEGTEFNRVETEVTLVTILIDANASTKIPTTVYDFELPILQEIHGDDAITEIEERQGVTTLTAGEAHRQLMAKYKTEAQRLIVKSTYRNAGALARKTGLPMGASDNTKGGKAPPAIDYSGTTSSRLMGEGEVMSQATTRQL